MADLLLAVKGLNAWYGESHILHGMEFEVREGEVVTLLGRNGAGKTTTMKAIMGMVGRRQGSISFRGVETIGLASNRVARLGIAICPEERGIFASLDVEENLLLPPQISDGGMPLAQIYELFPNLKERLRSQGTKLFAPVIVQQIGRTIERLKREGFTILLVEQNFRFAQTVADRHYIVEQGRVVDMVPNAQLETNMQRIQEYLGV